MLIKEAINVLEHIRENIETPIPKLTRTGWAITALSKGIRALENQEQALEILHREKTSIAEMPVDELLTKLTAEQKRSIAESVEFDNLMDDIESYLDDHAEDYDFSGLTYRYLICYTAAKRYKADSNNSYWKDVGIAIKTAVEEVEDDLSIRTNLAGAANNEHFNSLIYDYTSKGYELLFRQADSCAALLQLDDDVVLIIQ